MVDNRKTRAEETRRHLLAAATEVFSTRGYGGASVAAITDQADTAHGTFYLYFKNKESAFVEVVADVLQDLYQHSFTPIEELDGSLDTDRVRQRISGFLQAFARRGALWRALLEASLVSDAVRDQWGVERQRFRASIIERWVPVQAAGLLRDIDQVRTADALAAMIEWLAFGSVLFGEHGTQLVDDDGRALPEVVDVIWDQWVSTVRTQR